MHLTEQAPRLTLAERDRPAEIEVTEAMVWAGVSALPLVEIHFDPDSWDAHSAVREVYIAMRRQELASA